MIIVKLFTRPVIKGKRKWVEVNPKKEYADGTVFYLRWLPKGAANYQVKALASNMGLKLAQIACASFEPPDRVAPAAPKQQPRTLEELRTAPSHTGSKSDSDSSETACNATSAASRRSA